MQEGWLGFPAHLLQLPYETWPRGRYANWRGRGQAGTEARCPCCAALRLAGGDEVTSMESPPASTIRSTASSPRPLALPAVPTRRTHRRQLPQQSHGLRLSGAAGEVLPVQAHRSTQQQLIKNATLGHVSHRARDTIQLKRRRHLHPPLGSFDRAVRLRPIMAAGWRAGPAFASGQPRECREHCTASYTCCARAPRALPSSALKLFEPRLSEPSPAVLSHTSQGAPAAAAIAPGDASLSDAGASGATRANAAGPTCPKN